MQRHALDFYIKHRRRWGSWHPCLGVVNLVNYQLEDGRDRDFELTMANDRMRNLIYARVRRDGGEGGDRARDGEIVTERRTKEQTKTKKPPLYKVILLNDDYTPMEFVVEVLKSVFHKPHAEATRIMLHVHQNGMGVAGVYPYEIAETKVHTVEELARESQYPLKCVMEKE